MRCSLRVEGAVVGEKEEVVEAFTFIALNFAGEHDDKEDRLCIFRVLFML
ncbi:hypothetical protein A2U01_0040444 [Trifolium medium]|uniref:Uncharacterized protein n=1 Tax=Trifolium medium TaxID=97028 RepID=A0A392Q597_9FABA|nr:hypothetical protein [Trifolium medium]